VLAGLENINDGKAKLFTIFGAGLSDVPWICLGSGSSYARPLVDLLLADGGLNTGEHYEELDLQPLKTTILQALGICN
jgi:hypothetical protein